LTAPPTPGAECIVPESKVTLPRVLLLDLDDTILDDTGSVVACWTATCREFAGLAGVEAAALQEAIDLKRTSYWDDPERHRIGRADIRAASAHIVDLALQSLNLTDASLARIIADHYRDQRDEFICVFPGAVETLKILQQRGVPMALLTNGSASAQRSKVDRFGLAPFFDRILIEGELGFGKPDERVYRRALEALNASPEDAWCVGDNIEWDVGAPQQLGIGGVWVNRTGALSNPFNPRYSSIVPDRTITELTDLLR
jgi:putative hydrolase of the HAD superfamily